MVYGEVRPAEVALEEGVVGSSALGVAEDILAREGVLQLRGERVDTCQSYATVEGAIIELCEDRFDGLVGGGAQLTDLTDLLIGLVARLDLVGREEVLARSREGEVCDGVGCEGDEALPEAQAVEGGIAMCLATEAEATLLVEGHGVDELRFVGVGRLEVERLACGIGDGAFGGELIASALGAGAESEGAEEKEGEAELRLIHCLPCEVCDRWGY